MTFDGEKMRIKIADGSFSEIKYSNIQKVKVYGDYWLLYIAMNQWVFVTENAFKSGEDYQEFTGLIAAR